MHQVRIQSTPNPRARKYILNSVIKTTSKISYQDPGDCEHVPLAHGLLQISGVVQVHLFENVLTITQNGARIWQELDELVQAIVADLIDAHDPDFVDMLQQDPQRRQIPDHLLEVENILDATIRPSLHMDGGDVEVVGMEDDLITIRYLGACGGCPSSLEGTLYAIKQVIGEGLGRDVEVVAV